MHAVMNGGEAGTHVRFVEVGVANEDHALDGHQHAPQVGRVRVPFLRLVRAVPSAQQRQAHLRAKRGRQLTSLVNVKVL